MSKHSSVVTIQKQKQSRKRKKENIDDGTIVPRLPLPRIPKQDIRRKYGMMFSNIFNSGDYMLMLSCLNNLVRDDIRFVLQGQGIRAANGKSRINFNGKLAAGSFWYERMLDGPDVIFDFDGKFIKVRSDGTAVLTGNFRLSGTRIVHEPHIERQLQQLLTLANPWNYNGHPIHYRRFNTQDSFQTSPYITLNHCTDYATINHPEMTASIYNHYHQQRQQQQQQITSISPSSTFYPNDDDQSSISNDFTVAAYESLEQQQRQQLSLAQKPMSDSHDPTPSGLTLIDEEFISVFNHDLEIDSVSDMPMDEEMSYYSSTTSPNHHKQTLKETSEISASSSSASVRIEQYHYELHHPLPSESLSTSNDDVVTAAAAIAAEDQIDLMLYQLLLQHEKKAQQEEMQVAATALTTFETISKQQQTADTFVYQIDVGGTMSFNIDANYCISRIDMVLYYGHSK
jgi:hypothetical protein